MLSIKEARMLTEKAIKNNYEYDFQYFKNNLEQNIDNAIHEAANQGKSKTEVIISPYFCSSVKNYSNIVKIIKSIYHDYTVEHVEGFGNTVFIISWEE